MADDQKNPDPLDEFIATFADGNGRGAELAESLELTSNMRAPDFDEEFHMPKWKDENGQEVSVYGGMFQELAWIRRILIHGEYQRRGLIASDAEHKIRADAYSENQTRILGKIQRYTLMRFGFGVIQTAILSGILWQVWAS